MGSVEGLVWLAVALDFLGQFGALGSVSNGSAGLGDAWGFLSFAGLVVTLLSSGLLAWAGARFFLDTKRQQDLELLLTTAIGSRNALSGQWHVLRKALKFPLMAVLVVAVPAGVTLVSDVANGYHREVGQLLPIFLIPVNLAVEVVALCWMGMYFGLRGRTPSAAIVKTVGVVQIVPLAVALAFMGAWGMLAFDAVTPATARAKLPLVVPALLFFLAKNVALVAWARFRLRRDLRLKSRVVWRTRSWKRLVPQTACWV
jgi:hypothetical protein